MRGPRIGGKGHQSPTTSPEETQRRRDDEKDSIRGTRRDE